MNRIWLVYTFAAMVALVSAGCTNRGTPVLPSETAYLSGAAHQAAEHTGTHLWGYYDIYLDPEKLTIDAVPNRNAMFTANVVKFINSNPTFLSFKLNKIVPSADYIDVDIDVTIRHPFPGMNEYRGYDVRGIFMGNGSAALNHNSDLRYAVFGEDQLMFDEPGGSGADNGGPDGYTRWFNLTEFGNPSMPLFGYFPGKLASAGFSGTATLCPYKYFADGLTPADGLWTWLNDGDNADGFGVFNAGSANTRNYYLRFPESSGVIYGYAICANWEDPETHPSNAPEAVGAEVADTSYVWYVGPLQKGGSIKLDVSLWDWNHQPSAIFIESTVLSSVYEFTASDMTPIGGGEHYSTWHVEIPADNITGTGGNEYWVIAEYGGFDYSNPYGVMNQAWDDVLTAYFRFDLSVSSAPGNQDPSCDVDVVTSMPASGWGIVQVEFDASGSYDPDGDPLTYEWDFDNDGTFGDSYDAGTDTNPVVDYTKSNNDQVCLRLTDGKGGQSQCCVDVDITVASAKNMSLRDDEEAVDLAVDPNDGNLLILYDDGEVWEYTAAGLYMQSNASYLFTAVIPTSPWNPIERIANYRIDIAPSGNMIASGQAGSNGWPAGSWNASGVKIDTAPAPGAGDSVPDVFAFLAGGSYGNSHVFLCPGNGGAQNNLYRNYYGGSGWQQHYETAGENQSTGYQYVKFSQVVGSESVSGYQYWVIEDAPDYFASRWMLSGWYHSFDGAWFGTGTQTEADNGWYKAKDMTMDSAAHFYVLDELSSGQGRIKVFESGSPGNALTQHAAGDADSISESPLRIEGSSFTGGPYGNLIFVLHGDAIPCKLSVFFMSDFGF
jgi:hypothetical protein